MLTSADIKKLWEKNYPEYLEQEGIKRWFSEYLEMLKNVQQASPDYMKSEEFMSLLWEQNPISGVGQGTVDVEKVIKDKKLQQWFAQLRDKKYTDNINEELYDVYLEAMDKVIPLCDRTPRLKLNRLFAAIYPNNFGCVANYRSMKKLAKLLDVYDASKRYNPVWLNSKVNEKIDNALAQRAISLNDLVKRSIFQWFIFKHNETQTGSTDEYGQKIGQKSGDETLVFPPIERRLKGLAAIGGYSETVLRILDIARNGIRIDELKNWLKNEFPNFKLSSINAMLNVVRLQLGLLKLSPGNILEPNQIGIEYLENYDPDVLQPILLTKIIGFDRLLWRLRGNNGVSRGELVDDLQGYYKKWTSDFMPNTIINWAESFDLVNKDGSVITLTERGQQWAESIEEEPMNIKLKDAEDISLIIDSKSLEHTVSVEPDVVSLQVILDRLVNVPYLFTQEILATFHAALHSKKTKHFVLLSGLSGTGKTLLAQLYAKAYHNIKVHEDDPYFLLVPVQPDWTDPSGLLGYINTLPDEPVFMGTPCLEFLLSASRDPSKAYFLCLDEMNLARVEYYFAPFLSAMETGSKLTIHQNENIIDGIPQSINWPQNLFIIGTVNMDETTHSFSDKVLDRAFTIEFWKVDLLQYKKLFLRGRPDYPEDLLNSVMAILQEIENILVPCCLHFGYRTAEEILLFIKANQELCNGILSQEKAIDEAIYMKILPKIRGENSPTLQDALASLHKVMAENNYARSLERVKQMKDELGTNGTFRFWR